MDAESVVACKGRCESLRLLGHSLGDANVRIHEARPAEEPANRRRVDAAAFHPCDEVWQYPTLYGGRDDRTPVPPAGTFRPSGWRRSPFRASSPFNRAHLASAIPQGLNSAAVNATSGWHPGSGRPARQKRPPSFSRAAFYRLKLWI
jgi:hypothetical protein